MNGQFLAPTKTGAASQSQNGIFVAGMADFDARPLLKWLPVGMNLAYAITSPVGANGVSTLQEFGFGFYYTGRRDLSLGCGTRLEAGTTGEHADDPGHPCLAQLQVLLELKGRAGDEMVLPPPRSFSIHNIHSMGRMERKRTHARSRNPVPGSVVCRRSPDEGRSIHSRPPPGARRTS